MMSLLGRDNGGEGRQRKVNARESGIKLIRQHVTRDQEYSRHQVILELIQVDVQ